MKKKQIKNKSCIHIYLKKKYYVRFLFPCLVFNALQKDRFYSYNWIGQFWHNREIEKHIFRQIFLEIRSIKVSRLLDLIKTCQPEKGDVKDWANVTGNIFALSLCFLILKLYVFLHTIVRLMDIMIFWKWLWI